MYTFPSQLGYISTTCESGHGLTSHFLRISGQYLLISIKVYKAGGAVSSALPLQYSSALILKPESYQRDEVGLTRDYLGKSHRRPSPSPVWHLRPTERLSTR